MTIIVVIVRRCVVVVIAAVEKTKRETGTKLTEDDTSASFPLSRFKVCWREI